MRVFVASALMLAALTATAADTELPLGRSTRRLRVLHRYMID